MLILSFLIRKVKLQEVECFVLMRFFFHFLVWHVSFLLLLKQMTRNPGKLKEQIYYLTV